MGPCWPSLLSSPTSNALRNPSALPSWYIQLWLLLSSPLLSAESNHHHLLPEILPYLPNQSWSFHPCLPTGCSRSQRDLSNLSQLVLLLWAKAKVLTRPSTLHPHDLTMSCSPPWLSSSDRPPAFLLFLEHTACLWFWGLSPGALWLVWSSSTSLTVNFKSLLKCYLLNVSLFIIHSLE